MIYTASLACADLLNLEADVKALLEGGVHTLHLDLMDGHHVPALGFCVDTIAQLHRRFPQAELDAHLMVTNPEHYFESLAQAGVRWLSIVPQTLSDPARGLEKIRELGMKAGFVLTLDRSLEEVKPLLPLADLVVVMSVPAGGYGRAFQEEAYLRIGALRDLREEHGFSYLISVDGGVNRENSVLCRKAGADMLVQGVFTLFRQPQGIRQACLDYIHHMEDIQACNCN